MHVLQVPLPDLSENYQLQFFVCGADAYTKVTPAAHSYIVGNALAAASIISDKKGHDGRKTKPTELVRKFGTNPELIKNAGW